eukprot:3569007-Pyramimonas_sp.AAC.1
MTERGRTVGRQRQLGHFILVGLHPSALQLGALERQLFRMAIPPRPSLLGEVLGPLSDIQLRPGRSFNKC